MQVTVLSACMEDMPVKSKEETVAWHCRRQGLKVQKYK
jgi:hypothetical protein